MKRKQKPVQHEPENAVLIGYNHKKKVFIPDDCKHCFVCGTTGSGKTVDIVKNG